MDLTENGNTASHERLIDNYVTHGFSTRLFSFFIQCVFMEMSRGGSAINLQPIYEKIRNAKTSKEAASIRQNILRNFNYPNSAKVIHEGEEICNVSNFSNWFRKHSSVIPDAWRFVIEQGNIKIDVVEVNTTSAIDWTRFSRYSFLEDVLVYGSAGQYDFMDSFGVVRLDVYEHCSKTNHIHCYELACPWEKEIDTVHGWRHLTDAQKMRKYFTEYQGRDVLLPDLSIPCFI